MIGDPARLGPEPEALRRSAPSRWAGLAARAFHYAFRARPEDLGGTLAATPAADWTAAIETALRGGAGGDAGAEAVWISATDLLPDAALPEAPLLLLRAKARGGRRPRPRRSRHPGGDPRALRRRGGAACRRSRARSALARRLAVIETRQAEILEMLVERAEAALDPRPPRRQPLAAVVERLDAQGAALAGLAAETGRLAGRVARRGRRAAARPPPRSPQRRQRGRRLPPRPRPRAGGIPRPAGAGRRAARRRRRPSPPGSAQRGAWRPPGVPIRVRRAPRPSPRARRWPCAWPSAAACAPSAPNGSPAWRRPASSALPSRPRAGRRRRPLRPAAVPFIGSERDAAAALEEFLRSLTRGLDGASRRRRAGRRPAEVLPFQRPAPPEAGAGPAPARPRAPRRRRPRAGLGAQPAGIAGSRQRRRPRARGARRPARPPRRAGPGPGLGRGRPRRRLSARRNAAASAGRRPRQGRGVSD